MDPSLSKLRDPPPFGSYLGRSCPSRPSASAPEKEQATLRRTRLLKVDSFIFSHDGQPLLTNSKKNQPSSGKFHYAEELSLRTILGTNLRW
ncbi:hypothetical protein EW146_g3981 [Bondarzewia mesenterica]|uniref:Uncharacterized protein n=1 Tax=Bondarzewia mesenterica TaxID=1095465 RepID=A0A4V3XFA5_9AGAM|nr:hypothetical protein EW146_g3981 [Bondarzewia mesenterica]